jgi:hypothetical protein
VRQEKLVSGAPISTGSRKLKIGIAGAGITGAYLYRLLRNQGHEIDIYDIAPRTKCGANPCAWATSRGFNELVEVSGLSPEKYTMRRLDYLLMDEVRVKGDFMTINKPELIRDLLAGKQLKASPLAATKYDRVIDATGVSRAFLPKIENDLILRCVQYRVRTEKVLENRIRLVGIGYAWCFPLSENTYHIGCGSSPTDPYVTMETIGWPRSTGMDRDAKILCTCSGRIRLTAPYHSLPFVVEGGKAQIWGVGEAIGCVAPLAGDGIVPGMKSAQILVNHWNDPDGYTAAILKEFTWMKRERDVLEKLRRKEFIGIGDARVLRGNSRRMGMRLGLGEAAKLLMRMRPRQHL